MSLTLAEAWMDVYLSYRTLMAFVEPVHVFSRLGGVKVALVYIVVLRARVEPVDFAIREVHAVRIDVVPRIILLGLSSKRRCVYNSRGVYFLRSQVGRDFQVRVLLRFMETMLRFPRAEPSIITDTHDRAIILRSYKAETINGVLVSMLSQTRLHGRMGSGTGVPLEEVTTLSCANNHVGLVGVEHSFSDLILAREGHFRTGPQTQTVEIYSAIRLIKLPFITFAHTCQEELAMVS